MAEKQDIRENTMSGGTPARLRGLAANGNSISPTIQEVAETFGKGYAADLNNETDYGISGMFNADTINHPPISSDTIFGIYSNHRAKYITEGVFVSNSCPRKYDRNVCKTMLEWELERMEVSNSYLKLWNYSTIPWSTPQYSTVLLKEDFALY